jgi:Spy/CpxP family protein refolding chaperone
MSKRLRTLVVGAALVAGLATAPALYAQNYLRMPQGSMMGEGGMREYCNQMMQAMDHGHAQRPNEQWRSPEPERQPGQPRG